MSDQPYGGGTVSRNISQTIALDLEMSRGIDPERLAALPEDVFERLMRRVQYVDLAHARQNFRRKQQRDERGSVRPDAIRNALAQLDSIRAGSVDAPVAGIPVGAGAVAAAMLAPTAGLTGGRTSWKSLGPANIGGRTRAIVPHPQDPNVVWAASVGGGVWRTDDAGASWRPLDDMMGNLAVTCIAIDPTNAAVLYAGTGEGFGNGDAIRGAGIFFTSDGLSWRQIAATNAMQSVNRLAVNSDGAVLLAATPAGIFRSADAPRAVWTSTSNVPMSTVLCHPADPLLAIAGGLHDEAYFSTDGGQTWNTAAHADPWGGRVELTYARANADVVYASVAAEAGQIWRSSDGGRSYIRCAGTKDGRVVRYLGDQGWYGNVIWAGDANDERLVVVGGIDLWRSVDGGATLIDISTWYDSRSAHADHHCIASADPAGRLVYFGNDGGIYRTDDVRSVGNDPAIPRVQGWVNLNHDYAVTQFYDGVVSRAGILIGGAQDNGTLRYDIASGTRDWTTMFGGDGGYCASDPADSNTFYGEYVFLNLHRSDDAGLHSTFISGNFYNPLTNQWDWKPSPFTILDAQNQTALFIAPFAIDPGQPNVILAGGLSLWRTRNAKAPLSNATGPTWERIKIPVGARISALAVAERNSEGVWVGHEDGQLFRTSNATAAVPTWTRVGVAQPALPLRHCTAIVIDPADEHTIYVMYDGFRRDNVWKTTDGGGAWTSIGATLPEAPVRALAIHPANRAFLYLGTEVGVFSSEDGGATWSPTNEGPTNCPVDALFFDRTTLIVATHGRGMFSIDLGAVPSPRRRAAGGQ